MTTYTTLPGLTLDEAAAILCHWGYGMRVTERLHIQAAAVWQAHQPPVMMSAPIDWFADDDSEATYLWMASDHVDALVAAETRAQHWADGGLLRR